MTKAERAAYMREYRARRKAAGDPVRKLGLSGTQAVRDDTFPVCFWQEDRSQPLRTVSDPYPDLAVHVVRPAPRQHVYAE